MRTVNRWQANGPIGADNPPKNNWVVSDDDYNRVLSALKDLEMAVCDLMREEDFEVSETLSMALDVARGALRAGGKWAQAWT